MSAREIQFRGISVETGEWIYGVPITTGGATYLLHDFLKEVHCVEGKTVPYISSNREVKPETVGQYTGLKDRKGKKIFEGDVLANYTDQGPLYSVVVFDETNAGFGVSYDGKTPIEYETSFFGVNPSGCDEVIGNIHEKNTLGEMGEEVREKLGI